MCVVVIFKQYKYIYNNWFWFDDLNDEETMLNILENQLRILITISVICGHLCERQKNKKMKRFRLYIIVLYRAISYSVNACWIKSNVNKKYLLFHWYFAYPSLFPLHILDHPFDPFCLILFWVTENFFTIFLSEFVFF